MVVTTNITKGRYETVSSTLKMEVGTVQDKSRGTTFHGLSMKANMSPYLASNYKNEWDEWLVYGSGHSARGRRTPEIC